jgi:hypothetical protein
MDKHQAMGGDTALRKQLDGTAFLLSLYTFVTALVSMCFDMQVHCRAMIDSGLVPREQKMLKEPLPRAMYHQVY